MVKTIITTSLFILLAGFAEASFDVTPTKTCFVEGEPIYVMCLFVNDTDKDETLSLGPFGYEDVTITADGVTQNRYGHDAVDGIGFFEGLVIPHGEKRRFLLPLNEWAITLKGKFQFTAAFKVDQQPVVRRFAINVVEPDEGELATKLRDLFDTYDVTTDATMRRQLLRGLILAAHQYATDLPAPSFLVQTVPRFGRLSSLAPYILDHAVSGYGSLTMK